jgi:hypothetical protein
MLFAKEKEGNWNHQGKHSKRTVPPGQLSAPKHFVMTGNGA